jgi:hypothetical protein
MLNLLPTPHFKFLLSASFNPHNVKYLFGQKYKLILEAIVSKFDQELQIWFSQLLVTAVHYKVLKTNDILAELAK